MFQFITQQFNNLYSTTVNKNPDLRPGMTDKRMFKFNISLVSLAILAIVKWVIETRRNMVSEICE